MAKAEYAVVGGTTRKIKKKYAVVDGKTRKIKKQYAVIDGKTRLFWSGGGAGSLGKVLIHYGNTVKSGTATYTPTVKTLIAEEPLGAYTSFATLPQQPNVSTTYFSVKEIIYANERYYACIAGNSGSNYSKIMYADPSSTSWTVLVSSQATTFPYKTYFSVGNDVYIVYTYDTTTSSGSDSTGSGANGVRYHKYYLLNPDGTKTEYTYQGAWNESSGSWGSLNGNTTYGSFVELNGVYYTIKQTYSSSTDQGGNTITYTSKLCSASSIGGALTELGTGISKQITHLEVLDNEIYAFTTGGIYKTDSSGTFTVVNTSLKASKVLKVSNNSWVVWSYTAVYLSNTETLKISFVEYSNGAFTVTETLSDASTHLNFYKTSFVRDNVLYYPRTVSAVTASGTIRADIYYSLDYGKTWTSKTDVVNYSATNGSYLFQAVMCNGVQPY